MMSLNGPVPWMCKSRLFHSLFPSTSSFIFTAAKHSSGGFVNGNTTYVCLSVLFLLGWPIVRQGLDDCIFVVIWTWFVGFPFSFGQWIQNKWVVSGGKGFRVSRTFRWAGPLFRYGSLSHLLEEPHKMRTTETTTVGRFGTTPLKCQGSLCPCPFLAHLSLFIRLLFAHSSSSSSRPSLPEMAKMKRESIIKKPLVCSLTL